MKRKLTYEQLEDRSLCALDVKLSSSGTLKITGDNSPDRFALVIQPDGNGLIQSEFGFTSFAGAKSVQMDLKGGDDIVELISVQIPGTLKIKTGTGTDRVLFRTTVRDSFIGGATTLDLGKEDGDSVEMTADDFSVGFNGAATISSSDVKMTGVDFSGNGVRFSNGLSIKGPSGSVVNRIYLNGNGGNSGFQGEDISIAGNLSITSSALTRLHLDDVNVRPTSLGKGGKTTIKLSSAADQVFIDDSSFYGAVTATFGSGDDQIRIRDSSYNGTLSVDGGSGINIVQEATTSYASTPKLKKITLGTVSSFYNFPFPF